MDKNKNVSAVFEKQPAKDATVSEEKLVWSKAELKSQIRTIEHERAVALKQHVDEEGKKLADDAKMNIESASENFSKDNLIAAENNVIEAKDNLIELVNSLSWWKRPAWFFSVWGLVPIFSAFFVITASFLILTKYSFVTIMGIVPLWACLVAVIGASVQILVGVVQDYKSDCQITQYKRIWYLVVIPVSFALGFIALLLMQAGLLNISQGQIILNQAANQTITSTTVTQVSTNQTITQTATQSGTTNNLAVPIVVCFLVGYATDWFMGILGKLTNTNAAGK
jgi:hypothetical protein